MTHQFKEGQPCWHKIFTKTENPILAGWYDTNRGSLFYSGYNSCWSCRDDKVSEEYPEWWLREVPTPEFEEGEEIEVSNNETHWIKLKFIYKSKSGLYWVSHPVPEDDDTALAYKFARKIKEDKKQLQLNRNEENIKREFETQAKEIVELKNRLDQIEKFIRLR